MTATWAQRADSLAELVRMATVDAETDGDWTAETANDRCRMYAFHLLRYARPDAS